jgi:hypothetical protein
MPRTGYLIAAAVFVAVVAVSALVWSGTVKLPFFGESAEQLMARINDAEKTGGYGVTFSQSDVPKWRIAEGHRLERFGVDGGEPAFVRLTSSTALNATTWEWATQGLSATFPVEFNNRTNGQTIEIGVVARAASSNSASTITVVYATQQAGNSGWQDIPVSGDFELKTIRFKVPKVAPGSYDKNPIIVLNSDRSGSGKSVEILGAYVKPVGPQ